MLACVCCCLPYVLLLAWLSTNPLQVVSPPEVSFQKDCSPAEVRTRLLIVVCAPCVCGGGGDNHLVFVCEGVCFEGGGGGGTPCCVLVGEVVPVVPTNDSGRAAVQHTDRMPLPSQGATL
jgi:hypothetical protein